MASGWKSWQSWDSYILRATTKDAKEESANKTQDQRTTEEAMPPMTVGTRHGAKNMGMGWKSAIEADPFPSLSHKQPIISSTLRQILFCLKYELEIQTIMYKISYKDILYNIGHIANIL